MSQKLELTWCGKDKPIKPEPRILIKDDQNSNLGKDGTAENLLIHGDNILALKALMKKTQKKLKQINYRIFHYLEQKLKLFRTKNFLKLPIILYIKILKHIRNLHSDFLYTTAG